MIDRILEKRKFKVIVKPNSIKNDILGFDENKNALKINIAAPADRNKANIELVKFLSKILKKKVRIVSGFASREKIIEVI